jgi:hypothetical protein
MHPALSLKSGCDTPQPLATRRRLVGLSFGEQRRLRAQEFLVRCRGRRTLLQASTILLRVRLALHQLPQNLILLSH